MNIIDNNGGRSWKHQRGCLFKSKYFFLSNIKNILQSEWGIEREWIKRPTRDGVANLVERPHTESVHDATEDVVQNRPANILELFFCLSGGDLQEQRACLAATFHFQFEWHWPSWWDNGIKGKEDDDQKNKPGRFASVSQIKLMEMEISAKVALAQVKKVIKMKNYS